MLEVTSRSEALQQYPNGIQPPPVAPATGSLRMSSWAMDVWVQHKRVLTDQTELRAIMYEGAARGDLNVLGERFCVFDNSAVTGVLVLAQSHLSIHTWPEFCLANIDLLSCGDPQADDVLGLIGDRLGAVRTNLTCVSRAVL